jgi:glycosyltransferase involved in cell wall biosynthesis
MYNEEENVDEAVRAALEVLPRVAERFEIILVDDGSTDATARKARAWSERDPRVRLVQHERNRGYGATLRTGIASCRYGWIFYTDGDNQFYLEDLLRFLPLVHPRTVLTGYRAKRRDPWIRRLNAAVYNAVVAVLFGLRLRDVDCAFKLYPPGLFREIELRTTGAAIDLEILAKARRRGYRVREIPVRHRPRTAGRQTGARPGVILRAARELLRLWRELR